MIASILTALVLYSLFAGRLPNVWLGVICLLSAIIFLKLGKHRHDDVLTIDVYARRSRLAGENALWKTGISVALLILCICSQCPWIPLCLFGYLSGITVMIGGIKFREYVALLAFPVVFLTLSGLTLLWDFYASCPADAVLAFPFFGGWLAVIPSTQALGMLVLSRAIGALSCLYFLSLSTPMPELLDVLRRVRIPSIMIELAVLIYRYIFILLVTFRNMKNSASSRMGYRGVRRSIRTTGLVYGGLLANSFHRAGACFDAMESRCYTGQILFLTRKKKLTGKILVLLGVPLIGILVCVLLGW